MPTYVRRLFLSLSLLLSCFLASGCAQLGKSFGEIAKLHQEILKEFGEKDVGVNLHNDTSLTITFINSPLNAKDRGERAKRAEQTALFVSQHYPSINQIKAIWVGFVRQETRYIVVNYSESFDFFGFDNHARLLPNPDDRAARIVPPAESHPHAVYSAALNETDVRIERIQLEGDINFGFAVAPHFAVPGDATGTRRSSSLPRSVTFDFASYSEKSMFPGEPKITAVTEGKTIFETAGQFSTSKGPDGKFSEFLSLQIPYATFRRMIAGKKLRLVIGDREYEFTSEQLEALREMTQYVRD